MGIGDSSPQKEYCIYIHASHLCNKVYVGITKDVHKRWAHKEKSYIRCPHIYNAFRKYGWDNFVHVVLHDGLTKEEACAEEKAWIALFKLAKMSYNITDGGEGAFGVKYSEERKKKIKEWMVGRACSAETREKISKGNKGKKTKHIYAFNPETQEFVADYSSIREAAKTLGIKHTIISRTAKGITATAGGYIWSYYPYITTSKEVLDKRRDTPVYCYDLDGNYVRSYTSAAEAARVLKVHPCPIGQCCSKNKLQYKGFIWRRHKENIEEDILQRIKRVKNKIK